MDTYRILIYIDDKPVKAILTELPADLMPIDSWSRVPVFSAAAMQIELRRIT